MTQMTLTDNVLSGYNRKLAQLSLSLPAVTGRALVLHLLTYVLIASIVLTPLYQSGAFSFFSALAGVVSAAFSDVAQVRVVNTEALPPLSAWDALPAETALAAPSAQTPPEDPIYLVGRTQIGRTFNFSATAPNWADITPSGVGGILDFVLDPYHPYDNAFAVGDTGVWYTDTLANTTPAWTQMLTMGTINTELAALLSSSEQSECTAVFVRRILADPTREGRFMIVVTVYDPGAIGGEDCPGLTGITNNGGQDWFWQRVPECGYVYWFNPVTCEFTGGAAFGNGDYVYLTHSLPIVQNDPITQMKTYLSPNGGRSWIGTARIESNIRSGTSIYGSMASSAMAILSSRSNANHADNRLWRTLDGGSLWVQTNLPNGGVPAGADPYNLQGAVGQDGREQIFVSALTDNPTLPNNQGLYVSEDGGFSWSFVVNLPHTGFGTDSPNNYTINPSDPDQRLAVHSQSATDTSLIPIVSGWDGSDWQDKTGDWYDVFDGWSGADPANAVGPGLATGPAYLWTRVNDDVIAGDCTGNCADSTTGNETQVNTNQPVNIRNGNYVYSVTDMTVAGRNQPLAFHRVYSSHRLAWTETALGPGWTHNYNMRLIFATDPDGEAGVVIFQAANGARLRFIDNTDGTFTAEHGWLATLTRSGSPGSYTYTMTLRNQTRYQFDNAGRITQLDRINGLGGAWNPLVFTYDGSGRLSRVTDGTPPNERYIEFGYDASNRINEVRDSDSTTPHVTFSYNGAGELSSVTDIRGQTWTYTYQAGNTHRLIRVTDPLSHVVEEQDYDTQGRVIEQRNGEGDVIVRLTYLTDRHATVVEDGEGNAQTYVFNGRNTLAALEFEYNGELHSISAAFDPNYRTASVEDANGNATSLEWSSDGKRVDSITDALNNTTSFDYGSYNNLTLLTDARGNETAFEYTNSNFPILPTAIEDDLNNRTTFTYTGAGYLETVTDANNAVTRHTYNAFGQRTQTVVNYVDGVYNPAFPDEDLITTFDYDTLGRLTDIVDAQNRRQKITYDAAGNVLTTVRNYVDGVYNAGFPDQDIVTTMTYDNAGRLATVTDTLGRQTRFTYDNANRLTQQVLNYQDGVYSSLNPDQDVVTTYAYDDAGNLITVTDTLGRVDRTCYDTLNRPVRRVQNVTGSGDPCNILTYAPSGNADEDVITTMVYDANGNVTDVYDASNVRTHFLYDALNRQAAVIRNYQDGIHYFDPGSPTYDLPDQDVISLTFYDAVGNVSYTVGPDWDVTWMCYDDLNRPVRTVLNPSTVNPADPDTYPASASFDIDPASPSHPCHPSYTPSSDADRDVITTTVYDALGRASESVDPLGRMTRLVYDDAGRIVRRIENYQDGVFNPAFPDEDVFHETVYDPLGRVFETIDPLGRRTRFVYDGVDRQTAVIRNYVDGVFNPALPDEDVITSSTFDGLGRLLAQTDPNNNTTEFAYDGLDRLIEITDPLDHTSTTTYDGVGNVLTITDPLSHVTSFAYDGLYRQRASTSDLGLVTASSYDKLGRLIAQIDAENHQTRFTYDALGRTVQVMENFHFGPINDPAYPDRNVRTTYSYDVVGSLLSIALPSGAQVAYGYDRLSRRLSLDGPLGGAVDVWSSVYDKGGRVVTTSDPKGQTETMDYDALDRLLSLDYSAPATPDVSFTYDALGRRLGMTDGLGMTSYVYDDLDRITQVTDPLSQVVSYAYDAGGRRVGLTLPGSRNVTYAYDDANRLTDVTDWDAATTDVEYTYDDANRVSGMMLPNGVEVSYTYDDDNRLTQVRYQQGAQTLMQFDYTLDDVGNRLAVSEQLQPGPTLPVTPTLVSPASATITSDNTPTFTWNAVTGPNGPYTYELQVDDDPSFSTALKFTATGSDTTQTPPSAIPDAAYSWRVRAIDSQNAPGDWSSVWTLTVDTLAPAVPSLTSPTDNATVSTVRPAFSWGAVVDAVQYQLQVDNNSDFSSPEIDVTQAGASYTATVSQQQNTYSWRVRARDAANNWSAYSPARTFKINIQTTPVDGGGTIDTTPTFTWAAATGATQYQLQVDNNADFSSPEISVTQATTTYTPTTALALGVYYWRVNLNLGAGLVTSPFAWTLSITSALPAVPTLVSPANASSTNDNTPTFTWNAVTGPNGPFTYDLQVDNNSDFLSPEFSASGSETAQTPGAALADNTYNWRVRSRNNIGAPSAWSTAWTVTVDIVAPAVPSLTAPADNATVTTSRPAFSWGAVTGATLYQLQVDNNSDFSSPEIDVQPATASYTATVSQQQNTYYWRVRSRDAAGNWSAYSASRLFTLNIQNTPTNGNWTADQTPSFSWTTVTGVTAANHQIQVDNNADFSSPEISVTGPYTGTTTLTYTPTVNLAYGVYYWRVNVNYGSGFVTSPFAWSLTVSPAAPAATTLLTPANAASINDSTPDFTWNAVSGGGSPFTYEIQVDNNSDFLSLEFTATGSATAQTPATPLADATYNWRVRAINYLGILGAWSTVRTVTIDTAAPAMPSLTTPNANTTVTTSRPAFTWGAVTGATLYQLQVDNNSDFSSPEIDVQPATASYTATVSQQQNTYSWRVRARDAAGNWSDYSAARVFTLNIQSAPINGGGTTDTTPTFQWITVTGVTAANHQLQVDNNSDFSSPEISVTGPFSGTTTLSYTPTTALALGTYYWRVNVNYGSGFITSPFYRTLVIDSTVPAAPTLVSPASAAAINDSTPEFTWNAVSGATQYEIQVDNNTDLLSPEFTATGSATAQTPPPTAPLADATYTWRVRAINANGAASAWSATRTVTVDTVAPGVPSLTAPADLAALTTSRPAFSWGTVATATQYQLQVDDDTDFSSPILDVTQATASYTATVSLPQNTYGWRVRARDAAGNWGEYSAPRSFTIKIQNAPADNASTADQTPTFTWFAVTGATQYQIQLSLDRNFTAVTNTYTAGSAATSFTPTSNIPTGRYYWRVSANYGGATGLVPSPFYRTLTITPAPQSQTTAASRTINYTYDGLYRLRSADYAQNNLLNQSYSYSYDLMGNRTGVTSFFDGAETTTTSTYNSANQLVTSQTGSNPQRASTYDPNGNLTQITAGGEVFGTYTYDAADRLVSFTDASTDVLNTYTYNGMGDRYRQTVEGMTTEYVLDLNGGLTQVMGEITPGDDTWYLLGLDVIGQQQGSAWGYFGTDGLGSMRHMTDALGAVVYNANYDPYGLPLEQFGTATTNLGFTGEYTDPSGLLYLRARYMNPSLGMFQTADPYEGNMQQVMTRNRYIYVGGNPVNRTDPGGQCYAPVLLNSLGQLPLCDPTLANYIAEESECWSDPQICLLKKTSDFFNSEPVQRTIRYGRMALGLDPLEECMSQLQAALEAVLGLADIVSGGGVSDIRSGDPWRMIIGAVKLIGLVEMARLGHYGYNYLRGLPPPRGFFGRPPANRGINVIDDAVCSFSEDTQVATEAGGKAISELEVGDEVLAYNEETGETGEYEITAVHVHTDEVIVNLTIDGEEIETTPEHPFYTQERGWVAAGVLRLGEHIRTAGSGYGVVEAIAFSEQPQVMYNLTVDEAHTFFVGDGEWLVHNVCENARRVTLGEHGARQIANEGDRIFQMNDYEREFATRVLSQKPNIHVYRTPDGYGMGDFVLIDYSNRRQLVGWVVELKQATQSAQAGQQLTNAAQIADDLKLVRHVTATGSIEELLSLLSQRP